MDTMVLHDERSGASGAAGYRAPIPGSLFGFPRLGQSSLPPVRHCIDQMRILFASTTFLRCKIRGTFQKEAD